LTSSGAEVDSDDEGSNISCDSLNSSELNGESTVLGEARQDIKRIHEVNKVKSAVTGAEMETRLKSPTPTNSPRSNIPSAEHSLPQGLLQDIRDRTAKLTVVPSPCGTLTRKTRTWADELLPKSKKQNELKNGKDARIKLNGSIFKCPDISPTSTLSNSSDDKSKRSVVEERTYEERQKETTEKQNASSSKVIKNGEKFDADRFYKFHLNEHVTGSKDTSHADDIENEETFAGYRDLLQGKDSSSTIKSAKGTIRGVKNRVRAGIATFLQLHDTKNYKKEEVGKIVVYSTTMGIVRQTYQDCVLVKKILRNLMVKYEERDVFMSRETQAEIRERLGTDVIIVPQVFVEGQHIGNAETFEKLNESGELRRILKPFKSPQALSTCSVCGGHRLLPCSICNGSKKSVHRNEFTTEFVALKCMQCDEVGLVRCHAC
jgi:glutaredoxin domain-containing cysteine-rich protein 1